MYFNDSNIQGCYNSNFTNDFTGDPDGILTPIFLVDRGGCSFVTKVRNIQNNGGSLAVIIDDKIDEDVTKVIMSDDGTGAGITIPSMLISRKDGELLKQFLTSSDPELAKKASLSAEFVIQNDNNDVVAEIWYTSSNDRALDFIKNFFDDYKKLAFSNLNFSPHIVTWACP